MKHLWIIATILLPLELAAQPYTATVEPLPGEYWWGAVIEKGYVQPFYNFDTNQQRLPWQEIETGVRNETMTWACTAPRASRLRSCCPIKAATSGAIVLSPSSSGKGSCTLFPNTSRSPR